MIDRDRVYTYFSHQHGPITKSSNGWYDATCPICGKHKLAVHFDYLQAKCWRGCFRGFAMDLIKQYHDITYFDAKELIEEYEPTYIRLPNSVSRGSGSGISLPPGYNSILSGNTSFGDRARDYLEDRGFDLNFLDRLGVGYVNDPESEYFGYIIIPFKREGRLVYFIGRDYTGNYLRYKNPLKEETGVGKSELLFNEGALFIHDKVYLMEGWADAATIGSQGISTQGADLSVYQRSKIIESPVKEVVIIPDSGFYTAGLYMASILHKYKDVKVLDLFHYRDIGKDVNEIGADNVYQLEHDSPYVTKGTIYTQLRSVHKGKLANGA